MFRSSARTKRLRDDDDDLEIGEWPVDKKQRVGSHFSSAHALSINPPEAQALPAIIFSSALTPAHSDSGDSADSPPPSAAWMSFGFGGDIDMDEGDGPIASSPPLHSPVLPFSRPSRLDPQLFQQSVSGGRMPTPIYNSFSNHTLRPRNDTMFSLSEQSTPFATGPSKFPDIVQRMPSPISEDDADLPTQQTETQLSRLSVDDMDGIEEAAEAGPRKGRARSGAITGKRRFAMGYREDCEKCRMKIPGHYAHFLGG